MNRFAFAALAAIAIVSTAVPAFAADAPMRVKLADLDLRTPEGVKAAQKRINSAATRYCTVVETGTRLGVLDAECKDAVVAKSLEQLNTAVAAVQTGATQQAEVTVTFRRAA